MTVSNNIRDPGKSTASGKLFMIAEDGDIVDAGWKVAWASAIVGRAGTLAAAARTAEALAVLIQATTVVELSVGPPHPTAWVTLYQSLCAYSGVFG
jgi:hypothetical protein